MKSALVLCLLLGGAFAAPSRGYPYFDTPLSRGEENTASFRTSSDEATFRYSIPGHARLETRKPDGSVVGYYTYIDPNGDTARVEYEADKGGFRLRANNLPQAALVLPEVPQETPEVIAARREHLRLHAEAQRRQMAEDPRPHVSVDDNLRPDLTHVFRLSQVIPRPPSSYQSSSGLPHQQLPQTFAQPPVVQYYHSQSEDEERSSIPVSLYAAYYQAAPVAAVHDVQTSPNQRPADNRDQLAPILYISGSP